LKLTSILDRAGLSYTNDIEQLQNQLLRALNMNIIVEEQKMQTNSAKIRFYETLKILKGNFGSQKAKMDEQSEAKSAKRSVASKYLFF